ncbi:MAG: HD domain-containing protein [Sulfuricella sp.]|nr:HD domain-containing protein [Sulfuricella sp.]
MSWILLSLVLGGIDFYLEMEDADDNVMRLAVKESESFTGENLHRLNQTNADLSELRQKATEFLHSHFAIVELYNRDKQKILEEMDPGVDAVEDELKKFPHSFPLAESPYYRKLLIGENVFMQLLLPLRDKSGAIAGYFEGVYQVDAEMVQHIKSGVARALLLIVSVALITTLTFYPVMLFLHRELVRFASSLLRSNIELMEVLGGAVAKRDSDTSAHNFRVTIYAIRLAEAVGLDSAQIRSLTAGAFLHDVGKIGISDNVLLKPGKLNDEEFAAMRTHVLLGVDIIGKSAALDTARDVVECHHEKFDGSGYMRGLKGEEIPLNARIFAIVDVFDALTSKRPYKEPFSFDKAMGILLESRGSHFDPVLIEAFTGIAAELYREVSSASDAQVEQMLRAVVSEHFFNSSYLAQFLKKHIQPASSPSAG